MFGLVNVLTAAAITPLLITKPVLLLLAVETVEATTPWAPITELAKNWGCIANWIPGGRLTMFVVGFEPAAPSAAAGANDCGTK